MTTFKLAIDRRNAYIQEWLERIEHDVPIPKVVRRPDTETVPYVELACQMKSGDSIVVPVNDSESMRKILYDYGFKTARRVLEDGRVRLWAI
jgi:hypothetical protein